MLRFLQSAHRRSAVMFSRLRRNRRIPIIACEACRPRPSAGLGSGSERRGRTASSGIPPVASRRSALSPPTRVPASPALPWLLSPAFVVLSHVRGPVADVALEQGTSRRLLTPPREDPIPVRIHVLDYRHEPHIGLPDQASDRAAKDRTAKDVQGVVDPDKDPGHT